MAAVAPLQSGPERVPLWRNRDFLLLRTGQGISVLGSRVSSIAFPLLVLALTGSPLQAGFVGFLNTLPQLLFNLPAGAYVDRWDRRRVMLTCDAARLLAMGSLAVVLAAGRLSLWYVMGVAFVEGTGAVFFNLAENASLPRVVSKDQLPAAHAQNEAVSRGTMMLGQPLGGFLFSVGQVFPFAADAASYAVSVISLLLIRTPLQGDRRGEQRHLLGEIREGIGWLWAQPFLRMSTFLVAGTNLLFSANYLVIIVLAREHGASPATIGLIFAIGGAGGLLGALLAGVFASRLSLAAVVLGVNWLWTVLWPAFAVASNPLLLGLVWAIAVFAGPFWNVVLGSYSQSIIPDHLQARVGSVETLIAWGVIPLGSAISGILLQTIGPIPSLYVLGAGMLAIALAGTISPSIRHAPPLTRAPAN